MVKARRADAGARTAWVLVFDLMPLNCAVRCRDGEHPRSL